MLLPRPLLPILALLAVACPSSSAPPASAAPPAGGVVSGLTVTVDGEAFVPRGAILFRRGGSALTLEVSTEALTCASRDWTAPWSTLGGQSFRVTFSPVRRPDRTTTWVARGTWDEDTTWPSASGVRLLAAESGAPRIAFDQEVALPPGDFFGGGPSAVALRGEVVPEPCGVRPQYAVAPRPQREVSVSVGGRRYPIAGALIAGDGALWIASGPLACAGNDPPDMQLQLRPEDATIEATIHGDHFEHMHTATPDRLRATPGRRVASGWAYLEPRTQHDDGRVELALAGRWTIERGLVPVVISGRVEAIDCRRRGD
ncbi:MAG: hypothetical protein IT385_03075 [Deltaproteobacteria bacterium]|nr:hypothetical protein [Deltaproteobacteria bacterium]